MVKMGQQLSPQQRTLGMLNKSSDELIMESTHSGVRKRQCSIFKSLMAVAATAVVMGGVLISPQTVAQTNPSIIALDDSYGAKLDNYDAKFDLALQQSLFRAIKNNDGHMVRSLVSEGVDVSAVNRYGETALHMAAMYGHAGIVRFLVSKGADVNALNRDGSTPLHWAAGHGHAAIVKFLVSKGADVNVSNKYGSTPLHWAAENGHAAIVKNLQEVVEHVQPIQSAPSPR